LWEPRRHGGNATPGPAPDLTGRGRQVGKIRDVGGGSSPAARQNREDVLDAIAMRGGDPLWGIPRARISSARPWEGTRVPHGRERGQSGDVLGRPGTPSLMRLALCSSVVEPGLGRNPAPGGATSAMPLALPRSWLAVPPVDGVETGCEAGCCSGNSTGLRGRSGTTPVGAPMDGSGDFEAC